MGGKDKRARALEAAVNRDLTELAQGARIRVVWIEDPNRKSADPFAVSDALQLGGWDSEDGGYRRIVTRPGNYGRPLLTPDGRQIVYTDKQVVRKGDLKHLTPEIHLLDWSGRNDRVLGPGFAVDEDPATLGEKVVLPPFLEPYRQQIVAKLTPID